MPIESIVVSPGKPGMSAFAAAVAAAALFRYVITVPAMGNLGLFLDNGRFVLIPTAGGIGLVTAVIALFAALFSFFPARRGGRVDPVKALSSVF